MDNHIPIKTTTTTFDQKNNQLLLDAIKNKFAAQTANEAASYSPPKFTIPTLNTFKSQSVTTVTSSAVSNANSGGTNQLNQFLLKQLQEKQQQNTRLEASQANEFVLPQLNLNKGQAREGSHFEIPLLKSSSLTNNTTVSSLTTAIDKLKVNNNEKPVTIPALSSTSPAIDLSTALSSKFSIHQGTPPTREFKLKEKQENSDFEIPFIDCDRLDNANSTKSTLHSVIAENEYCLIDVSQVVSKPPSYTDNPSPVGKFLYLVDKRYTPVPLKCLTSAGQYKLKVKHNIQPFQFDTKSPDDKVLESLNKYGRR